MKRPAFAVTVSGIQSVILSIVLSIGVAFVSQSAAFAQGLPAKKKSSKQSALPAKLPTKKKSKVKVNFEDDSGTHTTTVVVRTPLPLDEAMNDKREAEEGVREIDRMIVETKKIASPGLLQVLPQAGVPNGRANALEELSPMAVVAPSPPVVKGLPGLRKPLKGAKSQTTKSIEPSNTPKPTEATSFVVAVPAPTTVPGPPPVPAAAPIAPSPAAPAVAALASTPSALAQDSAPVILPAILPTSAPTMVAPIAQAAAPEATTIVTRVAPSRLSDERDSRSNGSSPRLYVRSSYVDAHYSKLEADLQNGASTIALGVSSGFSTQIEGRVSIELGHGMDQAVTIQNTRFFALRADGVYLFSTGSIAPLASLGLGYAELDVKSEHVTPSGVGSVREHAKGSSILVAPAAGARMRFGSLAFDLTAEYLVLAGSGDASALGGATLALGVVIPF